MLLAVQGPCVSFCLSFCLFLCWAGALLSDLPLFKWISMFSVRYSHLWRMGFMAGEEPGSALVDLEAVLCK